jgi:hypothetical protein
VTHLCTIVGSCLKKNKKLNIKLNIVGVNIIPSDLRLIHQIVELWITESELYNLILDILASFPQNLRNRRSRLTLGLTTSRPPIHGGEFGLFVGFLFKNIQNG